MLVLVAYGSKRGGTAGLARMMGDAFVERGWSVEVRPAAEVTSVAGADVVVVGGALYLNRWHRDAVRFVRRHAAALRERPVWFFSSGPLDDSARAGDVAPVSQVSALAASIEIKGHMTFGGRLAPDSKGFIASRMAKKYGGDWRDADQVREWVRQIGQDPSTPRQVGQQTNVPVPTQRGRNRAPAAGG